MMAKPASNTGRSPTLEGNKHPSQLTKIIKAEFIFICTKMQQDDTSERPL